MNIKAQNLSNLGEKVVEVINTLPPEAKTVVVGLGTGTVLVFGLSELCKNATTFAKEGLPSIVENINKGKNLLKRETPVAIADAPRDTQTVDDLSAA